MLTEKDIKGIKKDLEGIEILKDGWEKDFKSMQDKSISDNVVYLKLVNYCFSNLRRIKMYSDNENLNKYLVTIKINKIREILKEYELEVQPSKHFVLLRINDYVQENRQFLDPLIDSFTQIFSSTKEDV